MDFFNDLNPYLVRESEFSTDIEDNMRQADPFDQADNNFRQTNFFDSGDTQQTDFFPDFNLADDVERQTGNAPTTQPPPILDFNPPLEGETDVPPTTQGLTTPSITPIPVIDQNYVENILRLNVGKLGTFYFTYTGSTAWRDKVYKGVIEQAGRDHVVVLDPKSGQRYLLQYVYMDYVEFDEEINYHYPVSN